MKTFNEYLTESPLSRVWAHFTSLSYPAGILSAFRGGLPLKTNETRTAQLAAKVRQAGLGYTFVDGTWTETDPDGAPLPVKETSLVIVGNPNDKGRLKGWLKSWMREFDQEAVVFKPQDSENVKLLTKDGGENDLGVFHANKAADIMTRLRGHSGAFVFEELAHVPATFMARLAAKVKR